MIFGPRIVTVEQAAALHIDQWPSAPRQVKSYFAAGGLAAGGTVELLVTTSFAGVLAAVAPNFFLQRYTLEVEMLKSFAMSLVFLPAWISATTLSQSTFFPAVAHAFDGLKPTPATIISARTARPDASFEITMLLRGLVEEFN